MAARVLAPELARGGHLPALDGIRGLAFGLVFLLHALSSMTERLDVSGLSPLARGLLDFGRYGVSLFFVLSAYLVTTLLLRERERTGRVDVAAFVVRRTLRIWPLYYAFLGLYFLKGRLPGTGAVVLPPEQAAMYGTFLGDLLHGAGGTGFLIHLWSLGVEEKFYLAWPWIVRAAPRERVRRVATGLFVLAWILRLALPPSTSVTWFLFGPIGALDALALGAILASLPPRAIRPFPPGVALALFLGVLVLASTFGFALDGPAQEGWGLPIAQGVAVLAGGALVLGLKDRTDGWPASRAAMAVGRLSYGAYLLHPAVLGATARFAAPGFSPRAIVVRVLAFGLTLALAWLSFTLYERPFLRLKRRFERVSV